MSLADLPITSRDRAADDMALLRQYVDEDSQDAFSALLDRHASWIHASARRALRTRDLADDATQTVFVILARKAPSIAPNVRVSGWLYHTTRFVISDLRKRSMRHRRRHDLIMRAALERRGTDSVRSSRRLDHVRDTISEALARLPEHERQAISLHFFEGMTFRQMGEVLGLSREGAKKRVARAMARLRAGFAMKGAAVAALATIGAAIRAIFAPATVKAAITTIGHPTVSLTKAAKIVGSGVKLLIDELTANAVRITAMRVATAGAVVGTAVLCGTQIPSSHQQSSAGRQVATRSPAANYDASRGSRLGAPSSAGAIASGDSTRNNEAPQGGLRTLATVAQPAPSVRGTMLSPRTIGPGNAMAIAQFEDPFKRPATYSRPSADRSEKPSTRVDDFRAAGGGGGSADSGDAPSSPTRKPLGLPLVDPKLGNVDKGLADAGGKSTRPDDAAAKPGGEVNRKVRRGSNDGTAAAANNTPAESYENLSLGGNGSGGKLDRNEVAKAPSTPATPGEVRPTLGIPPKAPHEAVSGDGRHDAPKPDDEKLGEQDQHDGNSGSGTGDHQDPAPPAPGNSPPDEHQNSGGQSGGSQSGGTQSGDNQSGDNQTGGLTGGTLSGDDGGFQPAPAAPPLAGGTNNYDLLDHHTPSPTPVTDELMPPTDAPPLELSRTSSGDLTRPALQGDGSAPVAAPSLEAFAGDVPSPAPSMRLLPEPSAGIVGLIAGVFGMARRRRRKS